MQFSSLSNRLSPARRRGLTLLETMVYILVLTMVIVCVLRIIGDSRMIRANARDRAAMTLIAQSELERWRAMPVSQLAEGQATAQASKLSEGQTTALDKTWPSGTSATISLKKMDGGLWEIDVRVRREGPEGKPEVRLTTLREGGTP